MSKFNRNKLDLVDLLETADHFMTKAGYITTLHASRRRRGKRRNPEVTAEGKRMIRADDGKRWSYVLTFKVIKDQLMASFCVEGDHSKDEDPPSHFSVFAQGKLLRKNIVRICKKAGLPMALANDVCAALDRIKG